VINMTSTTDHDWARGSQERSISTVLGTINVRTGGRDDGPAMVFWPSLVMTGSMFRNQYEHYAPTHRVILVDPPGIGKSASLRHTITLDQCSDCLLDILDALGVDTCVLVGNSWGAIVAGVFAARHPQRVSAAIAANGTASAATALEKAPLRPMLALLGLYTRTPAWFASLTRSTFAGRTARKTNRDFLNQLRCVLDEDPKSIAMQMKSVLLGRDDTHALLRSIHAVPVLVIAGEEDRQFSLATVQDVADTIPESAFVVLPATGHLSALESPELFNAALDEFLERTSSD
jgi:3-oxoadipate enol-lactonase